MHSGHVTLIESGSRHCPISTAQTTFTTNSNGTTTMIVNLGEHRNDVPIRSHQTNHNHNQHHTAINTSLLHQHQDSISDELTLLAPISTVTTATGVLLASSTGHHNMYQTSSQPTQHHDPQLKHHNQQNPPQQQIHVQHLNGCEMIITTTSTPSNNGGTIHHLGNDIQLFQIPVNHCNVINNNTITTTLNGVAVPSSSSISVLSTTASSSCNSSSAMSPAIVELQPQHVFVSTSNVPTTTFQSAQNRTVVEENSADIATDIDGVSVQNLNGEDDEDADLQLPDMADHSYSSQGSLEIDLDTHLCEDSGGGGE